MTPRCIVIVDHLRCRRPAARRMADLFCCTRHGRITLAVMSDWLSPTSRSLLAFARWETAAEGQRLLDRLYRRVA